MTAWALLAAALFCASAHVQQSTEGALEDARALKMQMRGQAPYRREAARVGAIRAFRAGAVGSGEPDLRALCALRAGELLQAAGLKESGLREFMRGAALSPSSWGQRSRLAAGEALIAARRFEEAARSLEAFRGEGVPSRLREQASVLRGVALARGGERGAALYLWREVALKGVTVRARIDSFERWGSELLKSGDIDGAAGVLQCCREELREHALEATARGREVRRLLRNSSLASSIRRAVSSR